MDTFPMLLEGDCLELMSKIPDGSVDLVLTDPPYGTTQCTWDTVIDLEEMWAQLSRVTKPTTPIVLMCSEPFTSVLISSNLRMFKYRWDWVKNKSTGFLNAKKQPLRRIEDIAVFYRKQCVYNPQKTSGHKVVTAYVSGDSGATLGETVPKVYSPSDERYPTNLIDSIKVVNNDGSSADGKRLNPTQKPIALMEYFIKTYSNPGNIVLDFTMGSGTTGIAATNLKRRFIGIEQNSEQFAAATKRIQAAEQTQTLF